MVVGLGLLAVQSRALLTDPAVWPPDDFVEYWAAGRLALAGQNPYDPDLLLPLEREAGRETAEAVMMWNPPWVLPVVMSVGSLPPRVAQLVWFVTNLVAVGLAADLLGRVYGIPGGRRWLTWAVAFTFVPTYLMLQAGQISGLSLLGAALFIRFQARGYDVAAGAAAVLLAAKPHLVYLLWPAVVLDAVAHRRWGIVAGGAGGGAAASVVPLLWNPEVFSQYLAAFRDHPPAQHVSLTLGTLLRLVFGENRFGLQFVPVAVGAIWFAVWWRAGRRAWDWGGALPVLVLASFVTCPYGAWHFDLVLLLVPVLQRVAGWAARPPGRTALGWLVAGYAGLNLAMLGLNLAGVYSYWYAWVAPAVLIGYVVTSRVPTRSGGRP